MFKAETLLRNLERATQSEQRKIVNTLVEVLEGAPSALWTGIWHIVMRYAPVLNELETVDLISISRCIVKSWHDDDPRHQTIFRFTAFNAQFVELRRWREALVTVLLETSKKRVRDALKLVGARHFVCGYWGNTR